MAKREKEVEVFIGADQRIRYGQVVKMPLSEFNRLQKMSDREISREAEVWLDLRDFDEGGPIDVDTFEIHKPRKKKRRAAP